MFTWMGWATVSFWQTKSLWGNYTALWLMDWMDGWMTWWKLADMYIGRMDDEKAGYSSWPGSSPISMSRGETLCGLPGTLHSGKDPRISFATTKATPPLLSCQGKMSTVLHFQTCVPRPITTTQNVGRWTEPSTVAFDKHYFSLQIESNEGKQIRVARAAMPTCFDMMSLNSKSVTTTINSCRPLCWLLCLEVYIQV